jgi:hypothetical protein
METFLEELEDLVRALAPTAATSGDDERAYVYQVSSLLSRLDRDAANSNKNLAATLRRTATTCLR